MKKKRGKKMKKKMFRSRISFSTISPFAAVSLRGVAHSSLMFQAFRSTRGRHRCCGHNKPPRLAGVAKIASP